MSRCALEAIAKYLVAIAIGTFLVLQMAQWASGELAKVAANL